MSFSRVAIEHIAQLRFIETLIENEQISWGAF
jgi:hypothetical protein